MEFDNPGFLVGNRQAVCEKVLVALDCDRAALQRAKALGCTLIVSHHPIIWEGLKSVTEQDLVFELIESGIAVISMHTNLDSGLDGVNDCLAATIGLENVRSYRTADGFVTRCGILPRSLSAEEFAERLKIALHFSPRFVDGGKRIQTVLLCGGSGGNYVDEAVQKGFDALVTADVKHDRFLAAADRGLSLFDGGHYATEDVVVNPLATWLHERFPTLQIAAIHPDRIRTV